MSEFNLESLDAYDNKLSKLDINMLRQTLADTALDVDENVSYNITQLRLILKHLMQKTNDQIVSELRNS